MNWFKIESFLFAGVELATDDEDMVSINSGYG